MDNSSRFRISISIVILLVLSACAAGLKAQAQSSDDIHIVPRERVEGPKAVPAAITADNPGDRLRVNVDLVMVPVSVTDSANRLVTGLGKEAFSLYEGGEAQQIRHFSTEDAPISVGVLLDLSKSMTNKIDDAREALREFFKTGNPEDEYFVITFADRP
ncbi:MAG: VWA domain-containing protein, partial [Acidobacteria bacterium]|nr:VWA domain-containing protein [Acidobacteriota bacterium]